MSAQLSLDSLSGIDWERTTLDQVEQLLIDAIPGLATRRERHSSMECVAMEAAEGWKLYVYPCLTRTDKDTLRWYVFVECIPPEGGRFWMYTHRFEEGQEDDLLALVRTML